MKKIKGIDLYNLLEMDERKMFKKERVYYRGISGFNFLLNNDYENFEDFIISAFDWSKTEKGFAYWFNLSKQKRKPIKTSTEDKKNNLQKLMDLEKENEELLIAYNKSIWIIIISWFAMLVLCVCLYYETK